MRIKQTNNQANSGNQSILFHQQLTIRMNKEKNAAKSISLFVVEDWINPTNKTNDAAIFKYYNSN